MQRSRVFLWLVVAVSGLASCADRPVLRPVASTGTVFDVGDDGYVGDFERTYTYARATDADAERAEVTDEDGASLEVREATLGPLGLAELSVVTREGEFVRAYSQEWDPDLRLLSTERTYPADPRGDTGVLAIRELEWTYDDDGVLTGTTSSRCRFVRA